MSRLTFLFCPAIVLSMAAGARAVELSSGPYALSDELGGIRLKSVSGSGTADDPIVIVEEFLSTGPAVLTIRRRGLVPKAGVGTANIDPTRLIVEKIVINRERQVWVGFDLELEEILGEPSTYEDGLSFDEISKRPSGARSDRFVRGERTFEPGDGILFFEGAVDPDDSVRFSLIITDPSPNNIFYLVQRPRFVVADIDNGPPPAALDDDPVADDRAPARVRLDLATARGKNEDAGESRDFVARRTTPGQSAAAERLGRAWKPER